MRATIEKLNKISEELEAMAIENKVSPTYINEIKKDIVAFVGALTINKYIKEHAEKETNEKLS